MRKWIILTLALLLSAGFSLGQESEEANAARNTNAALEVNEALGAGEELVNEALDRVNKALKLPRNTDDARENGAAEEEIQKVLKAGRERGVPAGDMAEIIEVENVALREGRSDNFGAAVQEIKASGLRGRELAQAIHAEQIARGMKKPKRKSQEAREERERDGDEPAHKAKDKLNKARANVEEKAKGKKEGKR